MATMSVVMDLNEDDGSSADVDAGTVRSRPRSTDWKLELAYGTKCRQTKECNMK
jgi:hypothetical protein